MAFTNTVETVGDAALTRSIIDRSITELNCNVTTSIRQQAFRACTALASVNFPNVASVALGAFWQCTALARAEFGSAVAFANNAFYGCTSLKALILSNTEQVCTASGTPFAASAIAGGTGYIYVPAALVDTYKAASGWSTYAEQIRSLDEFMIEELADKHGTLYCWPAVSEAIDKGIYASAYKIGDTIPLDLGSEGVVNMQIVAFDTDPLADGSGKSHISFISKELLKTSKVMNSSATTLGGWASTAMRTYLTGTIKPLIPSDVASMIKTVTKYTGSYNANGDRNGNEATNDDVWIPSYKEVNLSSTLESSAPCYSTAFPDAASRIKKKVGSSSAANWWLRTAISTSKFYRVNSSGNGNNYNADDTGGVALGFCA